LTIFEAINYADNRFFFKVKSISARIYVSISISKLLKTPKKIQIPFSEKELDQVLNQLAYPEGFDGIRDKLIIDLFYTTGIRRVELIDLKMQKLYHIKH
jgi:integrase/recombinase XerC